MFTIHELKLTDDVFDTLCQANPDLNFEQTAAGELVIVPPTGGTSGNRNSNLSYQLEGWNLASDAGRTFDSNTMFVLPNGAKRMPDASWVKRDRWDALTLEQQEQFPPLCPDFVVELQSPSDALADARLKMQEYLENGVQLGWLIAPKIRQVEIYRPNRELEIVQSPAILSGEEVLAGFVLDLTEILSI